MKVLLNNRNLSLFLIIIDLSIILLIISVNIYIKSIEAIKIVDTDNVRKIMTFPKYQDYFKLLTQVSIVIIVLALLITFILITKQNKYNRKKIESLVKIFNDKNLSIIEKFPEELSEEEHVILEAWNKKIKEILGNTIKREEYFKKMAHDFKIPLQIIKGNCEIYEIKYSKNKYITKIKNETRKLEKEVSNYLIIERISVFESVHLQCINLVQYFKEKRDRYSQIHIDIKLIFEKEKVVKLIDINIFDKIVENIVENAAVHGVDETFEIIIEESCIRFSNKKNRYSKSGNKIGLKVIFEYCQLLNVNINLKENEEDFSLTITGFKEKNEEDKYM